MPYLQKDSKTWTIGVQHAIIFEGRTACGQKGGEVFLFKGRVFAFSLSFLALISCAIIIKMIMQLLLFGGG